MKQSYGKNWSKIKKVETEVEKLASNKAGSAGTKKRAGNKKGRILQEKNNKGWTKSVPGHIIITLDDTSDSLSIEPFRVAS
jgi:hypothetical protein